MRATSVGIDGPVERQVAARHVIDDRLGLDLDELDAPEMRGIEGPSAKLEESVAAHAFLQPTRTYVR